MWATRTISWKESSTIRPTPAVMARSISSTVLLLPWNAMRAAGIPASSAVVSSPPEQTSRLSPSSWSQRTTARERKALPKVEDVGAGPERVGPGTAAGPEVGFVEEVGRGAELLGQPGDFDAADGQGAVLVPGDRAGPDLLVQDVEVLGGGAVVALRHDVGVTGPGGVCGSAHRVALLSRVSQRYWGALIPSRDRPCGQHRPGGLGEGEPGAVGGRGFLVPDGKG